ncbi:hypothetical protein CANMA_001578 [Candida margitis]|uniref:uncharacterized protein n=1 Tax=Candida margitis TaxID=1775924 RepID=UPI002227F6D8|nr:uncharacterized protein CANMA_001578 [Candida margitis]KAI5969510.1 hypothetical protein CANMA_001578 [Candida margitis]
MSSDEDIEETLAITASSGFHAHTSGSKFSDKLSQLEAEQELKTQTIFAKIKSFLKIQLLRYPNELEKYILEKEPNDCALIAKYRRTTDIDLSMEPSLTIDQLTLNTLHIPHPLESFMRNETHQQAADDVLEGVNNELRESPILVFIHGLGGQMSQFEPLIGLLSQCAEIVSLDLPGFGNSKAFDKGHKFVSHISESEQQRISASIKGMSWEDFSTANIVSIVYAFLRQQVPEKKVILIGHSMGTHIAVRVAKKLPPHKVEGLILLSPPDVIDDSVPGSQDLETGGLSWLFRLFVYLPFLFNLFRTWDRLPGLQSKSVRRQLPKNSSLYNRLRQFRWNLDIDSVTLLKYVHGFRKITTSDLVVAISQFNNNKSDDRAYEKTLLVCGSEDHVTNVKHIYHIDKFLTNTFNRKISSAMEVKDAGHSLLLAKPELTSGSILNHIETKLPQRLNLSPAWVLKVKALISGDKWGLKNEAKWLNLKPISDNITRGSEVSPLLGMKTLREGDAVHSPGVVESVYYEHANSNVKGKLIAVIDISSDIPPYNPQSFKHIRYYKCATVSKVVPDQASICRFINLVDEILKESDVEKPLIGVHCHYGFNRTGFLICCYLIEALGWSVKDAVEGFRVAKPPGIRHPHFIDALYVRYDT